MSALPSKAGIRCRKPNIGYGPKADVPSFMPVCGKSNLSS
jgi:hypothetical protein